MKSLRYTQRLAIARGIQAGKSNAQIAREIGVHRATIGREITRNAESREAYAAELADELSWQRKQDAVSRHRPVQFGGIAYFTELKQQHRFYCYLSKNHYSDTHTPDYYFPTPWDPAYIRRFEKLRLTADSSFQRLRLRFQLMNTLEPLGKEEFLSENPLKKELEILHAGLNSWRTIVLENIPLSTERLSVPRSEIRPDTASNSFVMRGRKDAVRLRHPRYRLVKAKNGKVLKLHAPAALE